MTEICLVSGVQSKKFESFPSPEFPSILRRIWSRIWSLVFLRVRETSAPPPVPFPLRAAEVRVNRMGVGQGAWKEINSVSVRKAYSLSFVRMGNAHGSNK